jgi:hypothetical protein
MGFDYSAVDGDAYFRLSPPGWSSVLYMLLDQAGLLDHEARPQPMPPEIVARFEEVGDESAWPLEGGDLSELEREYFGFGPTDSAKAAMWKLRDNEPWIITPREATVLADGVDRILSGDPAADAPPGAHEILDRYDVERDRQGVRREERDAELRSLLSDFAEFCRRASLQGGFWSH